MLRSRKRTCRRSKSRCGGTRHFWTWDTAYEGGSRRVRRGRRGGERVDWIGFM